MEVPMNHEMVKTIQSHCGQFMLYCVFQSGRRKISQPYQPYNRKERTAEHTYQMSRWTPYVKDIMEVILDW